MKKILTQNLKRFNNSQIVTRPPVVVFLGHVDHGKTTLLDAITGTEFVKSEFGEITQSINACQIETKFGLITFIDTPGHSYFTNLRNRGVNVADIALLFVSATEGVREQTVESIKLVKSTQTPLICIISKIDLKGANPASVTKQLAKYGVEVVPEGQVPVVEVSSVTKTGIENLIETISILATLEDLKANLNEKAQALVLESFLDKKAGPMALVLVKTGILKTGSQVFIDGELAKIRGMFDQNGLRIAKAYPSQPVRILGLEKVVEAGSKLEEQVSSQVTQLPKILPKTLTFSERESAKKRLGIIVKADTTGSKEAILANLPKAVNLVDSGVGQVTATDVEKATAFGEKIFGFNVSLTPDAEKLLEGKPGILFFSKLIYELTDQIKKAAEAFEPQAEKILGTAKILKSFDIDGIKIAGCKVLEGFLQTGGQVKFIRGEKVVGITRISSMKQFAKTVTLAKASEECGVGFAAPIDFAVGDVLKFVA